MNIIEFLQNISNIKLINVTLTAMFYEESKGRIYQEFNLNRGIIKKEFAKDEYEIVLIKRGNVKQKDLGLNLKVIHLKSELKSFSWDDGLFAIQKEVNGVLYLWKIKDGKLDIYEDGTPNITCTGINNKGITPTDLVVSV